MGRRLFLDALRLAPVRVAPPTDTKGDQISPDGAKRHLAVLRRSDLYRRWGLGKPAARTPRCGHGILRRHKRGLKIPSRTCRLEFQVQISHPSLAALCSARRWL